MDSSMRFRLPLLQILAFVLVPAPALSAPAAGHAVPDAESHIELSHDFGKKIIAQLPEVATVETLLKPALMVHDGASHNVEVSTARATHLRRAIEYIVDYVQAMTRACFSKDSPKTGIEASRILLKGLIQVITDFDRGSFRLLDTPHLKIDKQAISAQVDTTLDLLDGKALKFRDRTELFQAEDDGLRRALDIVRVTLLDGARPSTPANLESHAKVIHLPEKFSFESEQQLCHLRTDIDTSPPVADFSKLSIFKEDRSGALVELPSPRDKTGAIVGAAELPDVHAGERVFISIPIRDDLSGLRKPQAAIRRGPTEASRQLKTSVHWYDPKTNKELEDSARPKEALVTLEIPTHPLEATSMAKLTQWLLEDGAGNGKENLQPKNLFMIRSNGGGDLEPPLLSGNTEIFIKDAQGKKIVLKPGGGGLKLPEVNAGETVFLKFAVADSHSGLRAVEANFAKAEGLGARWKCDLVDSSTDAILPEDSSPKEASVLCTIETNKFEVGGAYRLLNMNITDRVGNVLTPHTILGGGLFTVKGNDEDSVVPEIRTGDIEVSTKDADGRIHRFPRNGDLPVIEAGQKVYLTIPIDDGKSGVRDVAMSVLKSGDPITHFRLDLFDSKTGERVEGKDHPKSAKAVMEIETHPNELGGIYTTEAIDAGDAAGNISAHTFDTIRLFQLKAKAGVSAIPFPPAKPLRIETPEQKETLDTLVKDRIEKLGSSDDGVRTKARNDLEQIVDLAKPALKKASHSSDLERRWAARRLLEGEFLWTFP